MPWHQSHAMEMSDNEERAQELFGVFIYSVRLVGVCHHACVKTKNNSWAPFSPPIRRTKDHTQVAVFSCNHPY